jgi:hypothetical protein
MAPEQLAGSEVTARSDIYALDSSSTRSSRVSALEGKNSRS